MRLLILVVLTLVLGCSSQPTDTVVTPPVSETTTGTSEIPDSAGSQSGTEVPLTPENTRIQFVGTHVGPTPDPKARTGHFDDFSGNATIEDDELKAISVEIQTASVDTGIDKLNNHLQAEDFFEVREYPTAEFQSTRIARDDDGNYIISGNLTLLATTKEITFPANVGMSNGQLDLSAQWKLDRTEFGMTGLTDRVNTEVALTIGVGRHSQLDPSTDQGTD